MIEITKTFIFYFVVTKNTKNKKTLQTKLYTRMYKNINS